MTSIISSMRRLAARARRGMRMNRFERHPQAAAEAEVEYGDGDFRVLRAGTYVRCAVTGEAIPLEELRYWNVDLQEAYSSPQAKLTRLGLKPRE
jgi:hypothetical protein